MAFSVSTNTHKPTIIHVQDGIISYLRRNIDEGREKDVGSNTNSLDLSGFLVPLFGAAVGSAATLTANWLRSEWQKPKIEIKYQSNEPFYRRIVPSHPARTGGSSEVFEENGKELKLNTAWERAKIKNTRGTVAKDVKGKLTSVINLDTRKEEAGLDHVNLAWVQFGNQPTVDIARGDCEMLGLAYKGEGWEGFTIYANPEMHKGMRLYYEGRHYLFTVVVYGSNFDPTKKTFEVLNSGKDLHDFSVRER